MATLYLHCAICDRKQARGLLSSSAWGVAPLPAGSVIQHPAVHDAAVRACPSCVSREDDWIARAYAAVDVG